MNQLKFPNLLDFLRSWNSKRKRFKQTSRDKSFWILLETSRFAFGRLLNNLETL